MEWCCSSSGKLTEVWLKTGKASLLLGLPEFDLNNEEVVRQVLEQVDCFLRQGKRIFVWVSLPCWSWNTWQYVNAWTYPNKVERIQTGRKESKSMLGFFLSTWQAWKQRWPDAIHGAFEWPRYCSGWRIKKMEELMFWFPMTCSFDGSQYGLENSGRPVKKCRRVQTDWKPLQDQLQKRCTHGLAEEDGHHESYSVCNRKIAYQSSLYTYRLVMAIIRGICATTFGDHNKKETLFQ